MAARRVREDAAPLAVVTATAVEEEPVFALGLPAEKRTKLNPQKFGIINVNTSLGKEGDALVSRADDIRSMVSEFGADAERQKVKSYFETVCDEKGEKLLAGIQSRFADIIRNFYSAQQEAKEREEAQYGDLTPDQIKHISSVRRIDHLDELQQLVRFCDVLKATTNQMIAFQSVNIDKFEYYDRILSTVLTEHNESKRLYVKARGEPQTQEEVYDDF